jgi:hypothetical protein
LLIFSDVFAARYQIQPTIGIEQGFTDNYRLTAENEQKVATTRPSLDVTLRRLTENQDLEALLRLDYVYYKEDSGGPDDDLQNESNQLARARYEYRGERAGLGIDGFYRRDTVLRTVRAVFEADDVSLDPADDDVDDAIVRRNIRRQRYYAEPEVGYSLTERLGVGLRYRYNRVLYGEPDSVPITLRDYKSQTVETSFPYSLTERHQLIPRILYNDYETDDGDSEFKTVAGLLDWEFDYSETASVSLFGGGYYTDYETPAEDGDNSGYIAGITGTQRTGRTIYTARLQRRLYPSGSGDIVETDELVFNISRRMTERLRFTLRSRAYENESTRRDNPDINRRFLTLRPALRYRLTQWWSVDLSYRYDRTKRDTDVDSADSNTLFITLFYTRPADLLE